MNSDVLTLHLTVNRRLEQISKLLPKKYRLTLIARNVEDKNADIVWTDDDVNAVTDAIRALIPDGGK